MKRFDNKSLPRRRSQAQTILELAVFGALVIFMLGVIIRQAYQYGLNQNINLRAMRQALLMSFRYSTGREIIEQFPASSSYADVLRAIHDNSWQTESGNRSRNTASILIVEDRLSPDSSKYGSVDRTPISINMSAVDSRNLFYQIDYGDDFDLPRVDFFINGAHFPLTLGGYRHISVDYSSRTAQPWEDWEPECLSIPCFSGWAIPNPSRCHPLCSTYDPDTYTCTSNTREIIGCPRFYKLIPNHQAIREWCYVDDASFPGGCSASEADNNELDKAWPLERRFDLGRDGSIGAAADNDVPEEERQFFAWQWGRVLAYSEQDVDDDDYNSVFLPSVTDSRRRMLTIRSHVCHDRTNCRREDIEDLQEINDELTPQNVNIDVDGDFKLETVLAIAYDSIGLITDLFIVDNQEGDLDFMHDTRDALRGGYLQPGLTSDLTMFTFINDGTVLEIDEGRLFETNGDTRQYVRSVQHRDHVDLIQRVLQLSHNTGRFCGQLTNIDDVPTRPASVDGLPNPVAVCCNQAASGSSGACVDANGNSGTSCFDDPNIRETCMELTRLVCDNPETRENCQPSANNIIFIRSRPQDRFGSKWITDVTQEYRTSAPLPGPALLEPEQP